MLISQEVKLIDANLIETNLIEADLSNANLIGQTSVMPTLGS